MGRAYTSDFRVPFTKGLGLAVLNRLDPDAAKYLEEMTCVGGESRRPALAWELAVAEPAAVVLVG